MGDAMKPMNNPSEDLHSSFLILNQVCLPDYLPSIVAIQVILLAKDWVHKSAEKTKDQKVPEPRKPGKNLVLPKGRTAQCQTDTPT